MSLEMQLAKAFLDEHPTEAALILERMPPERCAEVVREAAAEAASAIGEMVPAAVAECLCRLETGDAAPALDALPLDTAVIILRRMPEDVSARLIQGLPSEKQEWLRSVLRYAEGTAAALMDPAVTAFPDDISVAEARVRLRQEPGGLLYYLFVTDRSRRLVGVLDISELMHARARDDLRSIMHDRVEHLPAWTPAAAVRAHPGWRNYHAMPVTDESGRLVGAIRYRTLRRLEREAESGRGEQLTAVTVGALGELFHLGMAGFVQGVATTASHSRGSATRAAGESGAR